MEKIPRDRKVFRTAQAIMEAYDMSRAMFYHFVSLGMPVRMEKGCFWAHKDNIDDWFKDFTAYSVTEIPEGVE
ncbi:MAG: hypothetical protein JW882_14875 [Deltaproteobacteria bacterium]|nr:hypothetical protein [Deltaproteobacteria bacterium]